MSKLDRLKASLAKKEKKFNERLHAHIEGVSARQGQPWHNNAKDRAARKRLDNDDKALRSLEEGIEKTKAAIAREEATLRGLANTEIPQEIMELVDQGILTQWRKYPRYFFIKGVDKARISWDSKKHKVLISYAYSVKDVEQRETMSRVYNGLREQLNKH